QPRQVFTSERRNGGFEIAIELSASGDTASLIVEGLDASGALVANGASPPFPVGAVNGSIVIYMAVPNRVGAAPHSLAPARSAIGAATLPYGVIFAGGEVAAGASDAVVIYNAYNHTLSSGLPLPAPRAGIQLAIGTGNVAYMFGGRDTTGTETANLWRF